MALHIDNVRDCLYRQTSLSEETVQYENGGSFKKSPKEIRHRLCSGLQIGIQWDYVYDHDRLGGASVFIEGQAFTVISRIGWAVDDKVTAHKLALAAKRLMNELASNITDLAKRPKGV